MRFEFFKAFSPGLDTPIVELQVPNGDHVDVPAEVRREGDQVRISLFSRGTEAPWDYPVDDLVDAIRHAVEILGD